MLGVGLLDLVVVLLLMFWESWCHCLDICSSTARENFTHLSSYFLPQSFSRMRLLLAPFPVDHSCCPPFGFQDITWLLTHSEKAHVKSKVGPNQDLPPQLDLLSAGVSSLCFCSFGTEMEMLSWPDGTSYFNWTAVSWRRGLCVLSEDFTKHLFTCGEAEIIVHICVLQV